MLPETRGAGDARRHPLHQRSGRDQVQVKFQNVFSLCVRSSFNKKLCYVFRGTFLNTTGLAFSLGIAVAYLVSRISNWPNISKLKWFDICQVGIGNISVEKDKVKSDQVGGATSWRLAGLVPPFVSCVAIPILIIMKVDFPFLLVQPLICLT